MSFIKNKIKEKANFKIEFVEPIKVINKINIPGFFICGKKDKLIPLHHCKELYRKYNSKKTLKEINMSHN